MIQRESPAKCKVVMGMNHIIANTERGIGGYGSCSNMLDSGWCCTFGARVPCLDNLFGKAY